MTPTNATTQPDEMASKANVAHVPNMAIPAGAISAGLIAQLVGVGWEALWHGGLSSRVGDLGLPSSLGFLGDHIVSNLGVLSILGGVGWLLARKHSWRRSAVLVMGVGALLQAFGAGWDLVGHVRGSENNPIAYSLLGLGYILIAGGLLAALRKPLARTKDR